VIHRYRGWIDETYATEGRQESIAAWQRVFGDEFGKASVIKDAAADGLARVRGLLSSTAAHLNELVDFVKNYGISVLPLDFCRPPHMKQPTWRQVPNPIRSTWWPNGERVSLPRPAAPSERARSCRLEAACISALP